MQRAPNTGTDAVLALHLCVYLFMSPTELQLPQQEGPCLFYLPPTPSA